MLNKLILALFLTAVLVQGSDIGTRKSEELRAKVLGHSDIPKLSAAEYKYFLEESPRPYDVVVFFTAPNCNMCDEVEAELSTVANLYKKSGAIYPQNSENKKQRAVYFVKMTFEAATKDIFVGLQFRSVPNILVSTPKILRLRDNEKVEHYRSFLWQISMSDGTLTSQKLLDHVNKKTGRNVEYKESIINLFIVLVFLVGILGAGVFAFLKFRPFFLSTKLWFIGSMVLFLKSQLLFLSNSRLFISFACQVLCTIFYMVSHSTMLTKMEMSNGSILEEDLNLVLKDISCPQLSLSSVSCSSLYFTSPNSLKTEMQKSSIWSSF
jgi:oligosaccharyltransferase complex subunit gamma